ncbi:uncharacterized protein TNCT_479481 [Trichonephila clavata]|uniref:Peptidase aspartic putative domain-containing protein n=1 Tax=Trichonephila clavata TaxID=2740835 RepID=A0A8X6KZF1_TRICU|nr:uncharacterized protein TNCT_479481 [Trichonephila clavata]
MAGLELNEFSEVLLIHLILRKLDKETRKNYELNLASTKLPKWDDFMDFLLKRCLILENIQKNNAIAVPSERSYKKKSFLAKLDPVNCVICKQQPHPVFRCKKFNDLSVYERFNSVKKNNLCINCFSFSHRVPLCKSSRNCHNCSKRHNSLLCRNFERKFNSQRSQISETLPTLEPKNTTTLNANNECFKPKQTIPYAESFDNEGEELVGHVKGHSTGMLSTAIVYCQNNRGELFPIRTLLDNGNDLLTESGRKLQEQLVSLLRGAGMELHKWSASNPLLLADSMCQDKDLSYSSSTKTKTVGLLWKPHPDSFAFKISPMTSNCDSLIVTKKSLISTIARIFDPLGLIGPVITRAKILLQSLWQLKLVWNDPLPSNLVSYWKSFIDALESINCLNIPRYCLQDKSIRTELHGFSDSSEKAYGAALYLRCINSSGQISVRLLCSKSKVAPLKSAEATLENIRNSFWIPSARNVVRKILRTASPVEKLVLKVRSN